VSVPRENETLAGEEIQVVMTPAIQGPFREWLRSRGLHLFQIPVEDDLPTYGIGIGTLGGNAKNAAPEGAAPPASAGPG
jgi:hypothetical protein